MDKLALAKRMAKNMTPMERRLWARLRSLGFRPQKVLCGYIVDFAYPRQRLAIEVDGSVHNGREAYDSERDANLDRAGWRVVRFTNQMVAGELDGVVGIIRRAMQMPRRIQRVRHVERPPLKVGDAVQFGCAVRRWKRLHPVVPAKGRLLKP